MIYCYKTFHLQETNNIMKIKYFGTAAAEGIPALFCHCRVCEYARKNGGKDVRTRSQALIDDTLLLDFPPDTYMHALTYGLPLHKLHHCLVTHAHHDHLYPYDFFMRSRGYAWPSDEHTAPLNIYGSDFVRKTIDAEISIQDMENKNVIKYHTLLPFESYRAGEYEVIPLIAKHRTMQGAYIYIVKKEGKALLYAHDTGYFAEETWEYLEKNPVKFDYVTLDCCNGDGPLNSDCHMNVEMNLLVKERLTELNCADEKTIFCVNHFSHNAKVVLYDELVEAVKPYGFIVSYDGMEVEF